MAADELEHLTLVLRKIDEARRNTEKELASVKAQLESLIEILVGRDVLNTGHKRHFSKVATHSHPTGTKVHLRQYIDKYNLPPGEPIDCGALMHLCKGRCCALQVELTTQDIEEGKIRWDVLNPYVLRKEIDGRCTHQDRTTLFCTVYEHRPATCRIFDCREDRRIWLDFANKIPAPMTALVAPVEAK